MILVGKNKLIYLGSILFVMAAAIGFSYYENKPKEYVRTEQHISSSSEEELGEKPKTEGLVTHLPIISIDTQGQNIPGKAIMNDEFELTGYEKTESGEENIIVDIKTIYKENSWNSQNDKPATENQALIHIRGNSSRRFDKSNYRIELIKNNNPLDKVKEALLGMNHSSSWALHGPFLDKTLIRNYMLMNVAGKIMSWAPNVRFCELILNGEYKGVYVLMETVEVSEQRLDLFTYREGDPVMSYVVHIEPKAEMEKSIDTFSFYTKRLEPRSRFEISYPGTLSINDWVKDYISADINEIENMLFSYESDNNPDLYAGYLDEDSFVDYYIFTEFIALNDTFSASTYFYKDARGKLHIGPVWDFNNAFDNYILQIEEEGFFLAQRGYYSQLMKSDRFVEKVINRYKELRSGVLGDEYLKNYSKETIKWLGSAVDRNYDKWGYTFDWEQIPQYSRRIPRVDRNYSQEEYNADPDIFYSEIEKMNPSSFEEANTQMIEYMVERGKWLDENIESLRQYCHSSKKANTALY